MSNKKLLIIILAISCCFLLPHLALAVANITGYAWGENAGWVNFNPNYSGVTVNSDGMISGWAYSEKSDWLNFDSIKNISADDLQNEIISAKNMINGDNLSDAGTMSLLNSLCSQFFNSVECDTFNN